MKKRKERRVPCVSVFSVFAPWQFQMDVEAPPGGVRVRVKDIVRVRIVYLSV